MRDTLRRFISQTLLADRGGPLGDDDDLLATGVDSVGMMSLVLYVEEQWNIAVPPEDVLIENFESIRAIETYLRSRLNGH